MEKLLNNFKPTHYDLAFIVDKTEKLLTGETTISGQSATDTIKLHAKYLDISSISVNDQICNFFISDDILSIESPSIGEVVIKISYTHNLTENTEGAYLSTYEHNGTTEAILATQFESHYARECFPCVDEPAAKATFAISITADSEDTIISNMPAKSTTGTTTIFETTPIMSTYLVAFAVGKLKKLETTNQHGIKITTYASLAQPDSSLKFANDYAAKCLDFFDNLFKTPYPLPKLDQIALPDFESGAMENWGLVTYREQCLLADESSALDHKLYVATVIAHELSHQWFGNLVTMEWWDDLWLNESFASLIETYAVDKISPEFDAWDDFYSGTIMPALRRDCLPGVQAVKCDVNNPAEIATLFDGAIVYAKGARLMLMLMRLMGEDNFFAGLAEYFTKYAYQNTTADNLWDSLTPHANFDVKALMTPWLTQPGYPVISGDSQERFLIAETTTTEPSYIYPVPETKRDLSGHYLINLTPEEFSAALKNFDSLSKEQKLRLLIDHELLAKTPAISSVNLLSLLQQFSHETEYIIWDILSFIISDLKIFLSTNSEPEQRFKVFIKNLAVEQYRRLGLTAKPNESDNDTKLRPLILGLMLFSDDSEFKSSVETEFNTKSPVDIDPNIRHVVLSTMLRKNDYEIFSPEFSSESLIKLYKTTPDPELQTDIMSALTSSKNPDILKSYLPLLKDGTIRPTNVLFFFARLTRNQFSTTIALNWLYDNWEYLYKIEGDKTISDYPRIAATCILKAVDFETFQDFFTPKLNDPALARTLEIAFAEISARLDLIEVDGPSVTAALMSNI